jgi:unsaturated rhamnogalacturonyl hydrolase
MDRRHFIHQVTTVTLLASHCFATTPRLATHLSANVVSAPEVPLAEGKREPFGWKTGAISSTPMLLAWPDFPHDAIPTALRITVGLDVRDEKIIEAYLPISGRVLGIFDVRFGCLFQVFSIPLAATDVPEVKREGVALRLTKGAELRVFTSGKGMPAALQPHLLLPGTADPLTEFFARMDTLACVQAFSWQEGCVLDGLLDLAALPSHAALKDAASRHFQRFIIDGKLVYENATSTPSDGRIYGIEGALPYAALAKLDPKNPLLDYVVSSLLKRKDPEGCIQDGSHTSSEGAYTVGYPLAVIANLQENAALEEIALIQLSVRQARLFDGKSFWRTHEPNADGIKRGNRAWARGFAWQFLGYARTLRELKHRSDLAPHIAAFQALAAWVLPFQRPDGLWSVILDNPELTPDTSGSAGIAAALAIGAQQGWLEINVQAMAAKTLAGLKAHLTSDGLL